MFSRLPVRQKFLAANVVSLLVVALIAALYYPTALQQRTLASRRAEVVSLAETVALGVGIGLGISELQVVPTTFEWALRDPSLLYLRPLDSEGFEIGGAYNPGAIGYADHSGWDRSQPFVANLGDRLEVGVPITYDEQEFGALFLGVSLENIQEQLRRDQMTGLIASGLIFLIGSILSLAMAGRVVRPIEALRSAVGNLAHGNLGTRVRVEGHDEVAALGSAFNTMADRLTDTMGELETARDAALDAARAKADFLATMSHEIRTPMNGVLGMLDLLRRTDLEPSQLDYVSTAYGSGEALLAIINDILDFSKIDAGKIELDPLDFPIRDMTEDVCGLLATRADDKGVELICVVESNVPEGITADEGRLRQVLLNLIGNAIKFTDSGGEVVLRVQASEVEEDAARLRFSVRDTGIGIDEEAQKRLFTAFEQADVSTTRRFGGTGLGLAISKRLVEAMGGEIGLDSRPGIGSTFWFDIRVPSSELKGHVDESLVGVEVLVVDDNGTNRMVLQHQLEGWEMRCTLMSDGPSTIAALQASSPDQMPQVAILDMQMPGMDGLAVAQVIKGDPRTRDIRIVLATSLSDHGRNVGDPSPIDARLLKPIRRSALFHALTGVLSAGRPQAGNRGSAVPQAANGSQGGGARILLVEDNKVNQLVARTMLEQLGHTPVVVEDGQEAVDAVASGSFDLVLMDCRMPVMDGFEATRRIRTMSGEARLVPIVAMTANAMESDRQECLDAGMNDYISKPVSLEDLGAAIDRTFRPGRARA